MLESNPGSVPKPGGYHLDRIIRGELRFSRGTKRVKDPRPGHQAGPLNNPHELRAKVGVPPVPVDERQIPVAAHDKLFVGARLRSRFLKLTP